MNSLHKAFLCCGLMIAGSGNAMDRKIFEKNSYVRVVRGPVAMRGIIMKIQGSSLDIPDLKKHLLTDYPDDGGIVYYAKSVTSQPIKNCVHESWIEPENFNEDDEIVEWTTASLPGGQLVEKRLTRREVREKNKQLAYSQQNDFVAFKQEYINSYYPDVDFHKASLVAQAPDNLKQWFKRIKEGKKPEALLVYGAYGVGKTMTVEALIQDAGMQLCHFYSHAVMRWDYGVNRFKFDYLDELEKDPTCILVDNIEGLAEDDVENMKKLADHCAAKRNIHLIAIAYHAKKNMPPELYAKFRAVKFPIPDQKKKLALLKEALKETTVKAEVDDSYLNDCLSRVPDYDARSVMNLSFLARRQFRMAHHGESKMELSKDDFKKALSESRENRKQAQMTFDECE